MHLVQAFGAGQGGGVIDRGHGLAELSGQRQASRDECLCERGERLVERDQGLVHGGHGPCGDVGPALRRARPVERQNRGDVGGEVLIAS